METFTRQAGIFDPKYFDHYSITIVGCGAIGSFVSITLAKMGFKNLILVDSDIIEDHNLPNQFFPINELGYTKVSSLRGMIRRLTDLKSIVPIVKRFDKNFKLTSEVVIAATDNMESRKEIYEIAKRDGVQLLIDARMGGETFVVFTVNLFNQKARKKYEKTFHEDAEAPCTQRAIIYNVLFIAGLVANQLKKVMNGEDYSLEVNGDLKNLVLLKD